MLSSPCTMGKSMAVPSSVSQATVSGLSARSSSKDSAMASGVLSGSITGLSASSCVCTETAAE